MGDEDTCLGEKRAKGTPLTNLGTHPLLQTPMPAFKTITTNRLATVFRGVPSIGADEDLTAYAVRLAYDLGLKAPADAGVTGHHSWDSFLESNKDFQVQQSLNVSLPRDHEDALLSAPELSKPSLNPASPCLQLDFIH